MLVIAHKGCIGRTWSRHPALWAPGTGTATCTPVTPRNPGVPASSQAAPPLGPAALNGVTIFLISRLWGVPPIPHIHPCAISCTLAPVLRSQSQDPRLPGEACPQALEPAVPVNVRHPGQGGAGGSTCPAPGPCDAHRLQGSVLLSARDPAWGLPASFPSALCPTLPLPCWAVLDFPRQTPYGEASL